MNGIHDIGGMHGMGPVVPEPNEPAFHAPWEGRMHGIAVTCQISGVNATPEQRATIERMAPQLYLETSYYEKWLYAYEKILAAKGIISTEDIDRRVQEQEAKQLTAHPQLPQNPTEYAQKVRHIILNGTPHDRPLDRPPQFKVGDEIRVRNHNPTHHTRLPSFTKGRSGVIEIYHGAHLTHEPLARGDGEVPEHLYAVRFTTGELWGDSAESPSDIIYVDLFEHYIELTV